MKDLITFGELLLQLSPPRNGSFFQSDASDIIFSCPEANVAASAAMLGLQSAFVTVLPSHFIGDAALASLKTYGVRTDYIMRKKGRMGICYLEQNINPFLHKELYDRSLSAFSGIDENIFEWETVLSNAKWLHISGVTLSWGSPIDQICIEACRFAKAKGIITSCDIRFKPSLWSQEEAIKCVESIHKYIDVLIASESDFFHVFGKRCNALEKRSYNEQRLESLYKIATGVQDEYGFEKIFVPINEGSECLNEIYFSALMIDETELAISKRFKVPHIAHSGVRDAMIAGLISSQEKGYILQSSIDYSVGAGYLKFFTKGNFNRANEEDILSLLNSNTQS